MPNDLILIIDHRDTCVRMNGRALRIQRGDQPPEHVPLGPLGLVIVHGSPLIGCDVWRALAERNIPAVVQPARGRGIGVMIGPALGPGVALRLAQYHASADADRTLAIARRLVADKIDAYSQARALLDPDSTASRNLGTLQRAGIDRCDSAAGIGALMGIEGSAAAAWYDWLAARLHQRWRFSGRNRRPPRDPVNALLSLGYTLLGGEMLRPVQSQGLDPALGFLHGVRPGRESLVLDLIEPLRASVDLIVLRMVEQQLLLPTQFSYSTREGCRLNRHGRAAFYRAWASARGDWPDLGRPLTQLADRAGAAIDAGTAQPGNGRRPRSVHADQRREDTQDASPQSVGDTASRETDGSAAEPSTLPQLCRRRVDWLARRLRPDSQA